MVSILPAAAVSVLGALGITRSSAFARTLSPVAEPLFIAATALVLFSALACSRVVVLLSGAGTVLLYLSMFEVATRASPGSDAGSMSMMTMHQSDHGLRAAHADAPTFYLGLVLLVGAAVVAVWRRHRRECRPVIPLPQPRAAPR